MEQCVPAMTEIKEIQRDFTDNQLKEENMSNFMKYTFTSIILAAGMIISAFAISKFYLKLEKAKEISVKGFSVLSITSDIGEFSVKASCSDRDMTKCYQTLKQQIGEIETYIKSQLAGAKISLDNADIDTVFKKDEQGNATNELDHYTVHQWVNVTSKEVEKIKSVSDSLNDFISKGYMINIKGPHYYVSNLEKHKLELIAKATDNAYTRAMTIAKNSGGKVGKLSSAQQGVFQITQPNSTETSSDGVYDTSTIEKDIKCVITLTYIIE